MLTNSREWKNEEICLSSIFVKNSCSDFFSLLTRGFTSFVLWFHHIEEEKQISFFPDSITSYRTSSFSLCPKSFFSSYVSMHSNMIKDVLVLLVHIVLVCLLDFSSDKWHETSLLTTREKKEDGGGWREKKRTADNGDELFIDD